MVNMIMMRERRRLLMKMRMSRRRTRRSRRLTRRRMRMMCETLAGVRATLLWVEFCLLSPKQN